MQEPENTVSLVERAKQGESQAFAVLFNRYSSVVYQTAYGMLQNREDAEDITQEVFALAYKRLHTLKAQTSIRGWLYKITVNLCNEHLRRQHRRRNLFRQWLQSNSRPKISKPQESIEEEEFDKILSNAISKLPKIQRAVFVLRYFQELSYQEISEILGCTSESARANYYYEIKRMRLKLNGYIKKGVYNE
jgi:RNA polymerase sigma-70 factor (ECF subfamily)